MSVQDTDEFGYPNDPPEPVGTLDDALGLVGQLRDELQAVNADGLATERVKELYHSVVHHTDMAYKKLERAIDLDNKEHPEEL